MAKINTNIKNILDDSSGNLTVGTVGTVGTADIFTDYNLNVDWNPYSIQPTYGISVTSGDIQMSSTGDIKFGETSLRKALETIEQRLAILKPNEKLEAEWEELKELGDKYRALEKDLIEKAQVWDILKK